MTSIEITQLIIILKSMKILKKTYILLLLY